MPRDRLCYRDELDFITISCANCGSLFVQIEQETTCESCNKWEVREVSNKIDHSIYSYEVWSAWNTKVRLVNLHIKCARHLQAETQEKYDMSEPKEPIENTYCEAEECQWEER